MDRTSLTGPLSTRISKQVHVKVTGQESLQENTTVDGVCTNPEGPPTRVPGDMYRDRGNSANIIKLHWDFNVEEVTTRQNKIERDCQFVSQSCIY